MDDCLYCNNKEKLDSLMLYVADLKVSKLYLFKEQTYFGRCVVAYKDHAVELIDLDKEQAALLLEDVRQVGRALQKMLHPDKINYGYVQRHASPSPCACGSQISGRSFLWYYL